jgi:hypothetical protein
LINDKVEEDEMGRECGMSGEKRNTYRLMVRKPEGRRPLGLVKLRLVLER